MIALIELQYCVCSFYIALQTYLLFCLYFFPLRPPVPKVTTQTYNNTYKHRYRSTLFLLLSSSIPLQNWAEKGRLVMSLPFSAQFLKYLFFKWLGRVNALKCFLNYSRSPGYGTGQEFALSFTRLKSVCKQYDFVFVPVVPVVFIWGCTQFSLVQPGYFLLHHLLL